MRRAKTRGRASGSSDQKTRTGGYRWRGDSVSGSVQRVDMADDGAAKRLGKAMAVSVDGGVEMMVAERGIVGLLVVNRDS